MNPPPKITVLIAEDHAVVRQGLCALLDADGRFRVSGQAQTGREAVMLAARLCPDVILMDIAMPELNGLDAASQILAAGSAARVIILSAHNDEMYVLRANEAGVAGFLEKRMSAEHLTKAITEVVAGRSYYSPAIARSLRGGPNRPLTRQGRPRPNPTRLTARQTEVLQLIAEGLGNKQVGATLGISVKTVEKHRQNVMDKLNLHETAGLTRYAITTGLIENNSRRAILS